MNGHNANCCRSGIRASGALRQSRTLPKLADGGVRKKPALALRRGMVEE
jgi:hypothetical protein